MDDAARQQHEHEQRGEAVGVGGTAEQVELEAAEQLAHDHALQSVGAAGDVRQRVGELAQHQGHPQRDHQAREIAAAQHQEAGEEAQHRGDRDRERQSRQRIAGDVLGKQARRVGAGAEEGGMTQRDDAGVAQDQVEREREQRKDRDLVQDQILARRHQQRAERHQPEDDLRPAPAGASRQALRRRHQRGRANRPCGRNTSTAIMTR